MANYQFGGKPNSSASRGGNFFRRLYFQNCIGKFIVRNFKNIPPIFTKIIPLTFLNVFENIIEYLIRNFLLNVSKEIAITRYREVVCQSV